PLPSPSFPPRRFLRREAQFPPGCRPASPVRLKKHSPPQFRKGLPAGFHTPRAGKPALLSESMPLLFSETYFASCLSFRVFLLPSSGGQRTVTRSCTLLQCHL